MPEMEGTQFLRRVSELYPQNFRILVTGHATVAGTLSELSSGVVQQFIPKPWKAVNMRKALTSAQYQCAVCSTRAGRIKHVPFPPSPPSRK